MNNRKTPYKSAKKIIVFLLCAVFLFQSVSSVSRAEGNFLLNEAGSQGASFLNEDGGSPVFSLLGEDAPALTGSDDELTEEDATRQVPQQLLDQLIQGPITPALLDELEPYSDLIPDEYIPLPLEYTELTAGAPYNELSGIQGAATFGWPGVMGAGISVDHIVKDAFVNGVHDNGAPGSSVEVGYGDIITYRISIPYKNPGYDVLFVLDWSASMNNNYDISDWGGPGSAMMRAKQSILSASQQVFNHYPNSRIAVMGLNCIESSNQNDPGSLYLQYDSAFVEHYNYEDIINYAFDELSQNGPRYDADDCAMFLEAAYQKMTGSSLTPFYYNNQEGKPEQYVTVRDDHSRIPVIVLISDFELSDVRGDGTTTWNTMNQIGMKFRDSVHEGIILNVRSDHWGHRDPEYIDYYSDGGAGDNYMQGFGYIGHRMWPFVKFTSYMDQYLMNDRLWMSIFESIGKDQMVTLTDELPDGLEFVGHNGVGMFNQYGRTLTWDIPLHEGENTVEFQARVVKEGHFESFATLMGDMIFQLESNSTYHSYTGSGAGSAVDNVADLQARINEATGGDETIYIGDEGFDFEGTPVIIPENTIITLTPEEDGAILTQSIVRHFIVSGTLILDNITLQGPGEIRIGGGIQVNAGAGFTMQNGSVIKDCNANLGGGIETNGIMSEVLITGGSKVYANLANYGGGIYATGADTTVRVEDNCVIGGAGSGEGNISANDGGGIYLVSKATAIITGGAKVSGNIAKGTSLYQGGGGIFATESGTTVSIENGAVIGGTEQGDANTSVYGSGIYAADSAAVTIAGNSKVCGNTANIGGGGILAISGAAVTITGNSKVSGNNAVSGYGGGIYAYGTGVTVNVEKGSIIGGPGEGNNSGYGGGGIGAVSGAEITITEDAGVLGNTTSSYGGGIYVSGTYTKLNVENGSSIGGAGAGAGNVSGSVGGGICAESGAQVRIGGDSKVSGNIANGTSSYQGGGGIYATGSGTTVSVQDGAVIGGAGEGNTAGYGGGIFAQYGVAVTIDGTGGSKVSGNNATNGGGIYVSGTGTTLNVQNGGVIGGAGEGNTADYGGGIFATGGGKVTITGASGVIANHSDFGGGAMASDKAEIIITGASKISGNTASTSGGGIYLLTDSTLRVENGSIIGGTGEGNTASSIGGGIFASDKATVAITGASVVSGNSAASGGGIYTANYAKLTTHESTVFGGNQAMAFYHHDPQLLKDKYPSIEWSGDTSISGYHAVNNYDINFVKYEVTVIVAPAQGGEVIGEILYLQDDMVELTAVAKPGYEFDRWESTGIGTIPPENINNPVLTFTMPAHNMVILIAHFKAEETFTVDFDTNGGSAVDGQNVLPDALVSEPTPASNLIGHVFARWFKEDSLQNKWNFAADKVSENITLYARWFKKLVIGPVGTGDDKITGTGEPGSELTIEFPDGSEETTEVNADGTWELDIPDSVNLNPGDDVIVTVKDDDGDLIETDTGIVVPTYYSVTFNAGGGSAVAPILGVEHGSLISSPVAPTRTGYVFLGWYRENGTSWDFSKDMVNNDIILRARWSTATYTVTFNTGGGSAVASISGVAHGALISAPVTPTKIGDVFSGWHRENGTPWDFGKDTVNGDIILYARWAAATYTVTFNSGGGSAVAPISGVGHGHTIAEPIAPHKSGVRFMGWYMDNASFSKPWSFNSDMVTRDVTLYAGWLDGSNGGLTVTYYNGGGSGSVPVDAAWYKASERVTVLSNAGLTKKGHRFTGWTRRDNGELLQAGGTVAMAPGGLNLEAAWEAERYTLNFGSNGAQGTPPTSVKDAPYGQAVSLPGQGDMKKTESTFLGWSENPGAARPNYREGEAYTIPDDNKVLYAIWVDNPTITVEHWRYGINQTAQQAIKADTADYRPAYGSAFTATARNYSGYLLKSTTSDITISNVTANTTLRLYYQEIKNPSIQVEADELFFEVLNRKGTDKDRAWTEAQLRAKIGASLVVPAGVSVSDVSFTLLGYGNINYAKLGEYQVEVEASWSGQGAAVKRGVTVNVVDSTAPVIKVSRTTVSYVRGTRASSESALLSKAGVSSEDNYDKDIKVEAAFADGAFSDIQWNKANSEYVIYLNATDSSGNNAAQRQITLLIEEESDDENKSDAGGTGGTDNSEKDESVIYDNAGGGSTDEVDEVTARYIYDDLGISSGRIVKEDNNNLTVFDDSGVPLGKYKKDDGGNWVFIPLEGVPRISLPNTGLSAIRLYLFAVALIVLSILICRRKPKRRS